MRVWLSTVVFLLAGLHTQPASRGRSGNRSANGQRSGVGDTLPWIRPSRALPTIAWCKLPRGSRVHPTLGWLARGRGHVRVLETGSPRGHRYYVVHFSVRRPPRNFARSLDVPMAECTVQPPLGAARRGALHVLSCGVLFSATWHACIVDCGTSVAIVAQGGPKSMCQSERCSLGTALLKR